MTNNQNEIVSRYRRTGTGNITNDVLMRVQQTGNNSYVVTMNFNP